MEDGRGRWTASWSEGLSGAKHVDDGRPPSHPRRDPLVSDIPDRRVRGSVEQDRSVQDPKGHKVEIQSRRG